MGRSAPAAGGTAAALAASEVAAPVGLGGGGAGCVQAERAAKPTPNPDPRSRLFVMAREITPGSALVVSSAAHPRRRLTSHVRVTRPTSPQRRLYSMSVPRS